MRTTYEIEGRLLGDIWMPSIAAHKHVKYTFIRKEAERSNSWVNAHETLRDALLKVTNDGDFRWCRFDGYLTITRTRYVESGVYSHKRVIDLTKFPSIEDMVIVDATQEWGGWLP